MVSLDLPALTPPPATRLAASAIDFAVESFRYTHAGWYRSWVQPVEADPPNASKASG
jgi:hypothetical protein